MSSTLSTTYADNRKRTSPTPFRDAIEQHCSSKQLGENGMPEYTTAGIGSRVLGLSQLVRGGDTRALVEEILEKGDTQEIADLLVLLFATRNTRGGKGEKDLSYQIFLRVWTAYPKTSAQLLKLFPHYGYWKDFLLLLVAAKSVMPTTEQDHLLEQSLAIMKEQLLADLEAVEEHKRKLKNSCDEDEIKRLEGKGPAISLLAKWLPRENSSFDKKTGFVARFVKEMWPEPDEKEPLSSSWESGSKARYRRTVAKLTSYLALPEVLLAGKKEEEIRFQKLASKATTNLRKVFLNEDKSGNPRSENPKRIRLAERFNIYVAKKGLKGGQLMPHEIVSIILRKYNISKAEEDVLDAQWKDLWRNVEAQIEEAAKANGAVDFNPARMVPMADVSGSMSGTPMEVSIALSIGLSEITHEAFKGMVLTFDSTPTWHRLNPGDTIVQKVRSLSRAPWGMSTNFEAAYDLILEVAERAKLAREDMPFMIVFSDMQFDEAAGYSGSLTTMHDCIEAKVKRVADRLGWMDSDPTPIVYWNLRNTGGHPVDKDTEGAVLLAGFSPSLLKLVMHGEALKEETVELVQADGTVVTKKIRVTPEEILRKMLDDKLYDPVREILAASHEGKLKEYELALAEKL